MKEDIHASLTDDYAAAWAEWNALDDAAMWESLTDDALRLHLAL